MSIVQFYRDDPHAPKPTRKTHLGANAIITWEGKLLLEKRWDCDLWGLIGGGVKNHETEVQAMAREVREELGLYVPPSRFRKLGVYNGPGRIAAYEDGSVWRMVIVAFALDLDHAPELVMSRESNALGFFTKAELEDREIVITHRDIVEDWFLNQP